MSDHINQEIIIFGRVVSIFVCVTAHSMAIPSYLDAIRHTSVIICATFWFCAIFWQNIVADMAEFVVYRHWIG